MNKRVKKASSAGAWALGRSGSCYSIRRELGRSGLDCGWQATQWNDGTRGGIRYFEIGNGTMTGHLGGEGEEELIKNILMTIK